MDHSSDGSLLRQTFDDQAPGNMPVVDIVGLVESLGVDFLPITDHRTYDQHYDPQWTSDSVLLIPGEEANGKPHATVHGTVETIDQNAGVEGAPDGRVVQEPIWLATRVRACVYLHSGWLFGCGSGVQPALRHAGRTEHALRLPRRPHRRSRQHRPGDADAASRTTGTRCSAGRAKARCRRTSARSSRTTCCGRTARAGGCASGRRRTRQGPRAKRCGARSLTPASTI